MKKLIAISILLVVLTAGVFAQVGEGITISAWGRGAFLPIIALQESDVEGSIEGGAPAKDHEGKLYAGVGNNFSARPQLRVNVAGANADKNFGFKYQIWYLSDGVFAAGDAFSLWAAPLDKYLKIEIGRFNEDTLRGKIGDTDFHNYALPMEGNDSIFQRFQVRSGAVISSAPIDNLWIGLGAAFPSVSGTTIAAGTEEGKDVYKKLQIGAGYTIEGIGFARAQIFTNDHAYDKVDPTKASYTQVNQAEVAFALTAVENLTLDIGFKVPFAVSDSDTDDTFQFPLHAAVGANYTAGDFGILGRVDANFAGYGENTKSEDKQTIAPDFNIHLVPSYNLGAVIVGGEVGVKITGDETTSAKSQDDVVSKGGVAFGFGAWAQKSWGGGYIKAGFGYILPTKIKEDNADSETDDVYKQGVFTIPIVLGYSF
jgi:hypothetical protein